MANVFQGDKATAAQMNQLFQRLNTVRANQYARQDITASQLSSAWPTAPLTTGDIIKTNGTTDATNPVSTIKNELQILGTFVDTISTTFASNISIPSSGTLLRALNTWSDGYNELDSMVTQAESACPNCTFNGANFTSQANRGNFTNFTSSSSRGNFSSDFSSNNGSNFTSASSRDNFTVFRSSGGWTQFTTSSGFKCSGKIFF